MIQILRQRCQSHQAGANRAGALTTEHNFFGVSSEVLYLLIHPLQGQEDVPHAPVTRVGGRGGAPESQCSRTVIGLDKYHLKLLSKQKISDVFLEVWLFLLDCYVLA